MHNCRTNRISIAVAATLAVTVTGALSGFAEETRTYTKLEYAADTPKAHPAGKSPGEITIVIDPGHGGPTDLGALSVRGWCEKDANLFLSEDIKLALEAFGYNVVLTRRNDRAIPLYDRPRKSYETNADAFVSIHHNAPPPGQDPLATRYECVYAWNGIGKALAASINGEMAAARKNLLPNHGVMHANFAVTRNPEIPSCLVEADFVTHPDGEKAAWDPAIRRDLAGAIARGIHKWCRESPAAGKASRETMEK